MNHRDHPYDHLPLALSFSLLVGREVDISWGPYKAKGTITGVGYTSPGGDVTRVALFQTPWHPEPLSALWEPLAIPDDALHQDDPSPDPQSA